jgi:hypothetical protein
MKLFKRNQYGYNDYQYQHYQFLIIKGKTLLHLMYEDENHALILEFVFSLHS